jgi:hypothetical protein
VTNKSNNLLDDELKKMSLAQLDRVQTSIISPPSQQPGMVTPAYNFTMPPMSNQFIMSNNTSMFPAQNTIMQNSVQPSVKAMPAQWSQNTFNSFSDLSPLNKNKVPMNSMMGGTSLMGFHQASNVSNAMNIGGQPVKQLSSSEINDFLN